MQIYEEARKSYYHAKDFLFILDKPNVTSKQKRYENKKRRRWREIIEYKSNNWCTLYLESCVPTCETFVIVLVNINNAHLICRANARRCLRFILILTFIVGRWSVISVVIIIFVFVSFLFSSSRSWFISIIVSSFSVAVVFILSVLLVCQKLNLCNKSIISNGGNNVSRAARK